MTRNDFELIARAISRTRDELDIRWPGATGTALSGATLDALAENIANTLAGTNSRFDRPRFLDACGVPR